MCYSVVASSLFVVEDVYCMTGMLCCTSQFKSHMCMLFSYIKKVNQCIVKLSTHLDDFNIQIGVVVSIGLSLCTQNSSVVECLPED